MRKLLAIITVLCLLAVNVSASTYYVTDNARLLTSAETQNLEESFHQYHDEYGFSVAVVTVSSLDGQSPASFASAHYASAGYDNDGMMLLISERDGLWYLYTSGISTELITNEMIIKLGTLITADLESGKYYEACKTFTKKCTNPICEQINTNAVFDKTLERTHSTYVVLGLGGGLLIGIAAAILLTLHFRKPRKQTRRQDTSKREN